VDAATVRENTGVQCRTCDMRNEKCIIDWRFGNEMLSADDRYMAELEHRAVRDDDDRVA
jgi:hypothetical protein